MQPITLVFAAALACTYAQVSMPPGYAEKYPQYYKYSKKARHPRDLTWERNSGRETLFAPLGSTDDSVFGRGGYKQNIFDDHRGRLDGQAYRFKVSGPYGDISNIGGRLNWSNNKARVEADLQREISRRGDLTVTDEGS